jgi:hypothetical protein
MIRPWLAKPAMREWCAANGIDPERVVICQSMRRSDGAEMTWVDMVDVSLPPPERARRPIKRKIDGWPPRDTWPDLVTDAVRRAGQLDSPSGPA